MQVQIFDGGFGTMLQESGLEAGASPELMNIEHPEIVQRIHAAYIEAGSTIIETNTFGASRIKLEDYGLDARVEEINRAAVRIAKAAVQASGRDVKIAGSIGPIGRFVEPLGDLTFEEAYETFREQAAILADAGADILIFETNIDIQELRAGLLAAKDATDIPVVCQLTYSEDGRTVTGTDPYTAAVTLEAMGADVIGVNCSLGPAELIDVVKKLHEATYLPISVQPNAGMPCLVDGHTHFPMGAEEFSSYAKALVEAGASYIGGCCGTTPAHIKKIREALTGVEAPEPTAKDNRLRLTSRSRTVVIDKDLPTVLIGERINPTGRKVLAAEIRDGSFLSVKKEAVNQVKAGARVLDVNMGVAGIDQAEAMWKAVREVSQITDAPLVIDTSDRDTLEKGLRAYPGRALINSVSAETERIESFLPLAKKYGAAILCLPVTDEGIPKTIEEKIEAVRRIIGEAKKAGLADGDFLLDALVMTVSADAEAAIKVFDTLKRYRKEFGYPATMGLSNVSFGLPNRPLINSTFFAMCLAAGLDAPIMNPYDERMQEALIASAALIGKDPTGIAYSKNPKNLETVSKPAEAKPVAGDVIDAIRIAVIDGDVEGIVPLVEQAVRAGHESSEITERALTAAMEDIGVDFGAGRMFLPQVLLSAEAMKAAFDKIKELIPAAVNADKGTVVIATVKGDVHDLGKNIVSALLSNNGFKMIDLGKDVDSVDIVRAAIEHDADIVGLCALMTTTMIQIDKVIEELKAAGSHAKVMCGGAAVTKDYADAAGADAYVRDGVEAVNIAKGFMGE
ncbi:homocysteine S-methyltransferase family protein [Selenomonas sp. TAMA-11512]|uniref:homocysteine S-methyltransferase family protein n=1 Tax=Selenomonas sp. TAMA-11512 TaxID=3095337 RepID=UPI003089D0B1|nr:homocysteine S-methyltransferase family protein [Selenomonas sp. TAMA-11512]